MWKIAFGVALGIVLAGIIATVAEYLFAVALISEATKAFDKVFSTNQIQSANDPINGLRVAPHQLQFPDNIAQFQRPIIPQAIPALPKTKEQIVHENSKQAVMSASKDVEDFKAQYKKPEQCYNMKDDSTRVFCANHFIRARRDYEAKIAQK